MANRNLFIFLVCVLSVSSVFSQKGDIQGRVFTENESAPFATVSIDALELSVTSAVNGNFHIHDLPFGTYNLEASFVGYKTVIQKVTISEEDSELNVDFSLTERTIDLNQVVVTGTKTYKRQTDSPVIVNMITSKTLDNVQACNLSDGLKFQPGLRVETDCQTCNYTQLRMNGLAGGYSQVLINGRPIFSPLTGLYGLEQLPVNMIDRVEVVRGGGSSLYGSSAIGGTVNVITKLPRSNGYELNYSYHNINNQTLDNQISGNATVLSKSGKSGVSLFVNNRDRGLYDHNGDNFSELPTLSNTSFGANVFFLPKENQKLEISISNLNEYRFGGEIKRENEQAHYALQSEERTHRVWMGSADYQINFNNENSSVITYIAAQNTDRDHYTGIVPDGGEELEHHLENPPYGISLVQTLNLGTQVNHKIKNFLKGVNVLTAGVEYVYDDVLDEISAYNYLIDQTTKDLGAFVQSDWEITPQLNLLSGVRLDKHNLIEGSVLSPRASLLYKLKKNTQFRINYGEGFRAPQAFDADLHIAFAGGGISRVAISPDLLPETSKSWSGSINYDKPGEHMVAGFTIEGFYTRLERAFILQPIGEDQFGEVFEKQNGQRATVQGVSIEARANFDRKAQLETGFTFQTSEFDTKVEYIEGVEGLTEFIRTPNQYGFATLSLTPNKKISANLNYVFTGKMKVPHFAGAPNQLVDEIITSKSFSELNFKFGYTFRVKPMKSNLELYAGVRNMFNSYQDTFDIGKNRDSNFVYGPAQPRTIYVGIKLRSK